MKGWLKFIFILVGGFVLYLLTGSISDGLLLITILSYLEFRIRDKTKSA